MISEAEKRKQKLFYINRQSLGLCVSCGKPDERVRNGAARCAECNAKTHNYVRNVITEEERKADNANKREWYWMRKEAHVCVDCGTQDGRTLDGKSKCARCAKKRAYYERRNRDSEHESKLEKARRERWREQGLCTNCGHKREDENFKLCLNCRVRERMKKAKLKAKSGKPPRGSFGMCYQCNSRPAMPGKKVCKECYEVKMNLPQIKERMKK